MQFLKSNKVTFENLKNVNIQLEETINCYISTTFLCRMNHFIQSLLDIDLHLVIFHYQFLILMDSNKDILNRAIGRPAMMAFMILVGTYLTTGQLIPGVY